MNLNDDDDLLQHKLRYFDGGEEPRRLLPPIQGFKEMLLVSLERAVTPLVQYVPDIERYASTAKEKCKLLRTDKLSIDESASIMLYTMGWKPKERCLYVVLNNLLRSEERAHIEDWFLYLKLIISSLSKLPSISCHLFRGIKPGSLQEFSKGQKIVWWAFTSCTVSIEVLKNESFLGKTGIRNLFEIECNSGKDVSKYSQYKKEDEVLLLPARQFEIVGTLDVGNDLHIIQLKEIKPYFPLIDELPVGDAVEPMPIPPNVPLPPTPPSQRIPLPLNTPPQRITLPPTTPPQSIPLPPTKPPQRIRLPLPNDPNYRNPDLERRIAGLQPRSNMNFDGQRLTDQDMKIIVDQAIVERQCRGLSLQKNELTSQGISTLAMGVRESTTLEELNLSNNRLTDEDLLPLARELSVIGATTVEKWNLFGIAKVKKLEKAPIKILNLSHNNIGDEGANYLAEVLKVKRTLIQLRLNDNQIGDSGVQLLANALCDAKTNLTHLYLHNNRLISNLSVGYLTKMLHQNRSLNTLWLIDCNLTNADKQKLKEAVASKRKFNLIVDPS